MSHRSKVRVLLGALLVSCVATGVRGQRPPGPVCDAVWHDAGRNRDVPLRIRMPGGSGRVPVILFSHGLGGSLESGTRWTEAWAASGLATIQLQHPGSDRSLVQAGPGTGDLATRLRAGMSVEQYVARALDVRFVLDELGRRSSEGACDLSRLDTARVGVAGHSFGALTVQAVSGQTLPGRGSALRDPRVRAALAFSPSPPSYSSTPEATKAAFGSIAIPFFSITGTADAVPMLSPVTPEQRSWPYGAMPPGGKYLLVLNGADHMSFNGSGRQDVLVRARTGGAVPETVTAHVDSVVTAASTAFWRATLLHDAAAQALLDGGLQGLLAAGDRFQHK